MVRHWVTRFFPSGFHQIPGGLGGFSFPLDLDWLLSGEFRFFASSDVAEPDDFAPDGVYDQIGKAVVVPVAYGLGGVAPFGFARSLNRTVGACLKSYRFAVCFEGATGAAHLVGFPPRFSNEFDITSCVATDEIFVAVGVPVEANGSNQCAAL